MNGPRTVKSVGPILILSLTTTPAVWDATRYGCLPSCPLTGRHRPTASHRSTLLLRVCPPTTDGQIAPGRITYTTTTGPGGTTTYRLFMYGFPFNLRFPLWISFCPKSCLYHHKWFGEWHPMDSDTRPDLPYKCHPSQHRRKLSVPRSIRCISPADHDRQRLISRNPNTVQNVTMNTEVTED